MNPRISNVGSIHVTVVGNPAVFEIGDSQQLNPCSYAIAVQRQQAIFREAEFNFRDYPLFSRRLLRPVVHEDIRIRTINDSPEIRVDKIKIFSVSSSSIIHLGSSQTLITDSRIKNIRHVFQERPATL